MSQLVSNHAECPETPILSQCPGIGIVNPLFIPCSDGVCISAPKRQFSDIILIFDLDSTLIWEIPPMQAWDGVFDGNFLRPGLLNFLLALKSQGALFMTMSNRRGISGIRTIQAINEACGCQIFPSINDQHKNIIRRNNEPSLRKHLDKYIPYDVDRRRCILIDDSLNFVYSNNLYHSLPAFAYAFPKLDYLYGLEYRILPVLTAVRNAWVSSSASRFVPDRSHINLFASRFNKKQHVNMKFLEDYGIVVCRDPSTDFHIDQETAVLMGDEVQDPVGFTLNQFYPIRSEFTDQKSSPYYDRVFRSHFAEYKSICTKFDPVLQVCHEDLSRVVNTNNDTEEILCHSDKRNDLFASIEKTCQDSYYKNNVNGDCDVKVPMGLVTGFYRDTAHERLIQPDAVDIYSWSYLSGLTDDEITKSPLWNLWKRQYLFCNDLSCPVMPSCTSFKMHVIESVADLSDLTSYGGSIDELSIVDLALPDIISLDVHSCTSSSSCPFVPPDGYSSWTDIDCSALDDSLTSNMSFISLCDSCSSRCAQKKDCHISSYGRVRFDLFSKIIKLMSVLVTVASVDDQSRTWKSLSTVSMSSYLFLRHISSHRLNHPVAAATDRQCMSTNDLYRLLFPGCSLVSCEEDFFGDEHSEIDVEVAKFLTRTQNALTNLESISPSDNTPRKIIGSNVLTIKCPPSFGAAFWCISNMIQQAQTCPLRLSRCLRSPSSSSKSQKSQFPLADKTIFPIFIAYDERNPFVNLVSSIVVCDLVHRLLHQFVCPEINFYQFCYDCRNISFDPEEVFEFIHLLALKEGISNLFIMLWIDCSQEGGKEIRERHVNKIKEFCRPLSRFSGLGCAFIFEVYDIASSLGMESRERFKFC